MRYVIERCEHFHDIDGAITGSIGTVLDITDRKLTENALIEAKNRAESSSMSKNSFIASMSHELRTPLNAILGFSKRLSHDDTLNKQQKKYIGIINISGEHLLSILMIFYINIPVEVVMEADMAPLVKNSTSITQEKVMALETTEESEKRYGILLG